MINNNLQNQLSKFYNNRNNKDSGGVADVIKKLKEKQEAVRGGGTAAKAPVADNETEKQAAANSTANSGAKPETTDEVELSSEEQRQAALKKILEKLDAEEAARHPDRVQKKDKTDAASGVAAPESEKGSSNGVEGFLNDLPLFNEFKDSLISAFKSMDSATSGSISAQYELNYSSMQYIAAEGGGYEYKEVNFNLKLDLNYVKAAGGGKTGSEIASALENSNDFASLMSNLEGIAGKQPQTSSVPATGSTEQTKGIPGLKDMKPEDVMASLNEYFNAENTSGRIVDFATMFFPLSNEYKNGGDTEEARQAFADRMGKAIQKGFDQALGTLGKLPKTTSELIDKTHELTFKGLDDFVKNGLNKQKEESGVYSSLEQFAMSFQMSYSEKTVSVSSYNSKGVAQSSNAGSPKSINTEA